MITPAYVRTMAAYNAEMNRRLYDAAGRLDEAERRASKGAFWSSIHGTLVHILWGDHQWMSRFDDWPRPATPIKESDRFVEDFPSCAGARKGRRRYFGLGREDRPDLAGRGSGVVQRRRRARNPCAEAAARRAFLQPPDASSRPGACADHRRRTRDRRHRPVPARSADRRVGLLRFASGEPTRPAPETGLRVAPPLRGRAVSFPALGKARSGAGRARSSSNETKADRHSPAVTRTA